LFCRISPQILADINPPSYFHIFPHIHHLTRAHARKYSQTRKKALDKSPSWEEKASRKSKLSV
jgi:hypothetical protein